MTPEKHHVKVQLEEQMYQKLQKIKKEKGLNHDTEALRFCIQTVHTQIKKKPQEATATA